MDKKDDLPAMPFYWGEWFKSLDVQSLPRDVRCVWFEMLGRMWDSSERGYFTINGKPLEANAKASALGFGENVDQYLEYEKKLEDYGIFSRRESDGAIYSRFILKLVERRKKKQESGSKGGRKTQAGAKASALANCETEIESTNVLKKIFKNVPLPKVLDTPDCIKALNDFFQYRDEALGKPLIAVIEIETFLHDLQKKCFGNTDTAIKILKNSIVNRYPGIYELRAPQKNEKTDPEKPKVSAKKRWGVEICPHCEKLDIMLVSESSKGATFLCQNDKCGKEFNPTQSRQEPK